MRLHIVDLLLEVPKVRYYKALELYHLYHHLQLETRYSIELISFGYY